MKSQRLTIHGLEQQIYHWGNQASHHKLVLLHGWLDTGASFNELAQFLDQEDLHLIAPDLRGYGKSQHSSNPLGYFFLEYIADLHKLLELISPNQPVHLLGHSLGGAIGSIYAGTVPERLHSFINVEGFGFQRKELTDPPTRLKKWLLQLDQTQAFSLYPDQASFAERLQESYPYLNQAQALFWAEHMGGKISHGFQVTADPKHKMTEPYSFDEKMFFSFWKNISIPSLFILAEDSELAQHFNLKDFATTITRQQQHFPPKCKTVTLAHCGHRVHHEKPKELAKVLKKFLKPLS